MGAGPELAALVAEDLLADAADAGFTVNEDAAAAAQARAERPSEQSAVADSPQQAATETVEIALPALVEIPDDDEDDIDLTPAPASVEETDDEYAFDDDEKAELRRRLKDAERRAAQAEKLRLETAHAKWRAKMEKQYEFADWDTITGTSRRSFEKQAAESHNRNVTRLAPIIETLKARAEAEVKKAWGSPTTGPNVGHVSSSEAEKAMAEARKSGDLAKIFGVMRKLSGGGE